MTDATILGIVGAAQAVILGYLEIIRRSAKKCGSAECVENILAVVYHHERLQGAGKELERTPGAVAVKQGD